MIAQARDGSGERLGSFLKTMWGGAAVLLISPAVAMQLTDEVNWGPSDFALAAVLLFGSATLIHLVVRSTSGSFYRAGAVVATGTAFLVLWANAAVGLIGAESHAINGWFYGVVLFAVIGTVASRARACGMAATMALTGLMQMIVAGLAAASDPRGSVLAACLAVLWMFAAALFLAAARSQSEEPLHRRRSNV